MRECTHFVKAEQPRNLGYMQLGVIKVLNCQIAPQLLKYFSEARGLATYPVSRQLVRRLPIELPQNFPVEVLPPSCFERCQLSSITRAGPTLVTWARPRLATGLRR